jgi:hexosaminidase
VEKHGKKMVGWDEIFTAGVSSSAVIMNWQDTATGIAATKKQYEVIMSPHKFVYLDYMQADAITEPPVYASLRLSKTYQFDPIPAGADVRFIKGGQGNLWTEQVYNIRQAEYMTWPRGFAIAEALWSPKEKKNWLAFIPRVEAHFKRLDAASIKYAPSLYDPIFDAGKDEAGKLFILLSTEIPGLDIHYSFDNSFPDQFYPKYTEKIMVPVDAKLLRVITYKNGKPIGRMQHMPIAELWKRVNAKQK